jgi:hypothetical protein
VRKNLPDTDLPELFKRLKKAIALCTESTDCWIEVLAELPGRYSADREFGAQLEKHGIDLKKNDRVALIGLGRLGEKRLREVLSGTDSRSYQLIWRDHGPMLKVVE